MIAAPTSPAHSQPGTPSRQGPACKPKQPTCAWRRQSKGPPTLPPPPTKQKDTYTYLHVYIYIYIYIHRDIYIYMYANDTPLGRTKQSCLSSWSEAGGSLTDGAKAAGICERLKVSCFKASSTLLARVGLVQQVVRIALQTETTTQEAGRGGLLQRLPPQTVYPFGPFALSWPATFGASRA